VVELGGGEAVTADEEYIRESILSPGARIVSGYGPIMPSFEGILSEDDLGALIEYVRLRGG
jgi:cytochrome c oxidase subunit 2